MRRVSPDGRRTVLEPAHRRLCPSPRFVARDTGCLELGRLAIDVEPMFIRELALHRRCV
jgi:hypothetical protein